VGAQIFLDVGFSAISFHVVLLAAASKTEDMEGQSKDSTPHLSAKSSKNHIQ